jgi:hypothetical protein
LRPDVGPDWLHEIKHDGYRLIVQRDGKRVRLFTRRAFWSSRRYWPRSNTGPNPPKTRCVTPSSKACGRIYDGEGRSARETFYPSTVWAVSEAGFILFFLSFRCKKLTASSAPFTPSSWQRRYASPVEESSRKNSFNAKPSMEASTKSVAPFSVTSLIVHDRRQVPSMAIMCAEIGCSKVTYRFSLRFSWGIGCNPTNVTPLVALRRLTHRKRSREKLAIQSSISGPDEGGPIRLAAARQR